jgi:hypothetical protein
MTRLCLSSLVCFFACSIFLEGCGRPIRREVAAIVFQTKGEISITPDRRLPFFAQSQNGWCLHVGDRLKTNAAASIDFAAVPGTLVHLSDNSELLIENLSIAKDGNLMVDAMKSRDVRLRLIRGILSIVVGDAGRNSHTAIVTPTGHFFARPGSTFRLEVTDGKTRATCARGKVAFQPKESGPGVGIGDGYFQEWPATDTGPRLAAESGAQAQAEVAQLLEVERNLLSLEERERAKPPRRSSDGEGEIFGKILKHGSCRRLQLFSHDDRNFQRSLWFHRRFFGGSCCILFGRAEPSVTYRRDYPRRFVERRAERKRSARRCIHKCSFICRASGKKQRAGIVCLGCRHTAA